MRTATIAFVPTGHPDNSPAFQRRGACARPPVPPGRLNGWRIVSVVACHFVIKISVVPAGLRWFCGFNPALKCRAIVITSPCDGQTRTRPNSGRAGQSAPGPALRWPPAKLPRRRGRIGGDRDARFHAKHDLLSARNDPMRAMDDSLYAGDGMERAGTRSLYSRAGIDFARTRSLYSRTGMDFTRTRSLYSRAGMEFADTRSSFKRAEDIVPGSTAC